jgi:hypothetical protein
MHGQTNKQAEGNEDISHYKNISQPTLADIIKHPDKYIQSIGSYIFYNDFAWLNDVVVSRSACTNISYFVIILCLHFDL